GEIALVFTHHDRMVLGGAVPAGSALELTGYPEIRSEYFLEHRELGIINVGDTGTVTAGGVVYDLDRGAFLCLGRSLGHVVFRDASAPSSLSARADGSAGAQFYLFSAPAHT